MYIFPSAGNIPRMKRLTKDVPSITDTAISSITPNQSRTLRYPDSMNSGSTPINVISCLEADVSRMFVSGKVFSIHSCGRADLSTKSGPFGIEYDC